MGAGASRFGFWLRGAACWGARRRCAVTRGRHSVSLPITIHVQILQVDRMKYDPRRHQLVGRSLRTSPWDVPGPRLTHVTPPLATRPALI